MTGYDPREAWNAMRRRAAAVLGQHLPPPPPGDREDNERAAAAIFWATFRLTGDFIVGNADEERAKLDNLVRCARELSRIYASLDRGVRDRLWAASYELDPREFGMPPDRSVATDMLWNLEFLPDALARVRPQGIEYLKAMTPAGRANWRAISAVGHCRNFWLARTGDEAPSRGLNPASPFARFLVDMLDALEIKANPVAAFDAWRRVETYPEDTA